VKPRWTRDRGPRPDPALLPTARRREVIAADTGVRVYARTLGAAGQEIATWATGRGLHIESISTRGPVLEDVFLALTAAASAPSEGPGDART
jgi:hypothetical protein